MRLYHQQSDAHQRLIHFLRLFSMILPLSPQRRGELVPHVISVLQKEGFMIERRYLADFEIIAEERGEARGEARARKSGSASCCCTCWNGASAACAKPIDWR